MPIIGRDRIVQYMQEGDGVIILPDTVAIMLMVETAVIRVPAAADLNITIPAAATAIDM